MSEIQGQRSQSSMGIGVSNNMTPYTTNGRVAGKEERLRGSELYPNSSQLNFKDNNLIDQTKTSQTDYFEKKKNLPTIVVTQHISKGNTEHNSSLNLGSSLHSKLDESKFKFEPKNDMKYKLCLNNSDLEKGCANYQIGTRGNAAGLRQQRKQNEQIQSYIIPNRTRV